MFVSLHQYLSWVPRTMFDGLIFKKFLWTRQMLISENTCHMMCDPYNNPQNKHNASKAGQFYLINEHVLLDGSFTTKFFSFYRDFIHSSTSPCNIVIPCFSHPLGVKTHNRLTLWRPETPKWVLPQTVKTQMKCRTR